MKLYVLMFCLNYQVCAVNQFSSIPVLYVCDGNLKKYTKGYITVEKNKKTKRYYSSSEGDPRRLYRCLKMSRYIQQKIKQENQNRMLDSSLKEQ